MSMVQTVVPKRVLDKWWTMVRWMTKSQRSDAYVHFRLEMSDLGKIFDHPIIDMEECINTWIEKGTVLKLDKREMGKRCSDMFKLVLCRMYFEERNKWPSLRMSDMRLFIYGQAICAVCGMKPQHVVISEL